MSLRRVYLFKYRSGNNQRAHFAIFIPNAESDVRNISNDYRSTVSIGTVIHVIGEPVMAGYQLEIKRNYNCSVSRQLQKVVFLGYVGSIYLYDSPITVLIRERTPRGVLEREAVQVPPPPGGQNVRAPIDGINTKRCQEWTMEYLKRLADLRLISYEAVGIAQNERDPPNFGIFGQANPRQGTSSNVQWVWDERHQRYRYWDGSQWRWQQR